MRRFLLLALVGLAGAVPDIASAQSVRRDGYVRRDTGTYVPPSRATRPDSSRLNNYSTRGNVNPYSGRSGTRSPFSSPSSGRRR